MDWKKSSFFIGAGMLGGIILQRMLPPGQRISPEKALKHVKRAVQEKYHVNGSWIHMQPEAVERYGLDYDTYQGGITVSTGDQVQHYHFVVAAKNGTILEFTADED